MMNFPVTSFPNDIISNFKKEGESTFFENVNKEHRGEYNPYINNSGTVLAIGGKGHIIVAGDTRLSKGYQILSRDTSKIENLTDTTFLATSGMYADFTGLTKQLQAKLQMYQYSIGRKATFKNIHMLLSRTLYMKRSFPFYTFNLLAGFDESDNGIVVGYDAVGSGDFKPYGVQGSASQIIIPLMDNVFEGYNKTKQVPLESIEQKIEFVLDAFNSAAERDIHTGDSVEIYVIEKGKKPHRIVQPLRRD